MKTFYGFKSAVIFAAIGGVVAVSHAASWTVLDDFSSSAAVTKYRAYDSDTAAGRDVVYGLDNGQLKPINTLIRAGYAGGFWWTGGEVLKPGDSVKADVRTGAGNICGGFRFSGAPFGKALTATDTTSSGTGTIEHGTGTVYASSCWVNVYQRAGETQFQLHAGTGGTGIGGAITDGIWLGGAQPTTNDFFTLVVTRGTGANQNVLAWSFEGNYLTGNTGTVSVAGITAGEGLYFAMNLNGSSINTRFDNLALKQAQAACSFFFAIIARSPAWAVPSCTHRLVLQVPASPMMDNRNVDERPAIVEIDFTNELSKVGFAGKKPDLATLQLIEFDPDTGDPVSFTKNAIQQTLADRPVRWYDDAIPFSFPDFAKDIHSTGGIFSYNYLDRWGYFYETVGDWKKGRIGWVHTQRRNRLTSYAAYFNLMDEGGIPFATEPRGMIGDGINRTEETGDTGTGQLKTTITLDDWNSDGLVDIIAGCARGQITWWPNAGTAAEPEFICSRMLFMEDGKPLDVGMQGVPAIVDWDGDGKKDLIISSLYRGHLNFFKNVGTNTNRVFSYRGFLKADGADIESPSEPNPETKSADGVQSILQDYYSVPVAVDWDKDGDLDLLTGGYVTGQINLYKNTGADTNGIPVLTSAGPITADGGSLDVGWSAAPAVADINNDGNLDLISGLWSKPGLGGVVYQPGEVFLRYFEGIGTSSSGTPLLALKPFPKTGSFPALAQAVPAFFDFNNDNVLDLVVGAGMDIYFITNIGTAEAPDFDAAHMKKLLVKNGSSPLPLQGQFQDLNGDGHPDIVEGTAYRTNIGEGYPFRFSSRQSYLPAGVVIDHPVAQGDGWRSYLMADLDNNGTNDVLFGDFWGQIWFHRNLGGGQFDTNGVLVVDTNGVPIHVPASLTPTNEWDFTTMQGSRIMFACAGFSGDSRKDIITRDTDGTITLFEQTGFTNPLVIVMKSGIVISGNRGRGFVYDIDWNGDGRRDVYLPGSGTNDIILLNTGAPASWTVEVFNRPGIPVEGTDTSAQPVDLNEDGDLDILVTSGYRFTSLFEKTFLEQGYAQGRIITLEQKPAP